MRYYSNYEVEQFAEALSGEGLKGDELIILLAGNKPDYAQYRSQM